MAANNAITSSEKRRSFPKDILKRYEIWKDIVTISGPPGLRLIRGFRDEALSGEWRVIYRVVVEKLTLQVASITAHDYRRP